MSFDIEVVDQVVEKLEDTYRDRKEEFGSQIDKLEDFPKKHGKPLSGKLHGIWQLKFGRGDRIWYTVDENEEKVSVINLLSKKEAEKRY